MSKLRSQDDYKVPHPGVHAKGAPLVFVMRTVPLCAVYLQPLCYFFPSVLSVFNLCAISSKPSVFPETSDPWLMSWRVNLKLSRLCRGPIEMGIAGLLPPGLQPLRLGAETLCYYQFLGNTDRKAQVGPSKIHGLTECKLLESRTLP